MMHPDIRVCHYCQRPYPVDAQLLANVPEAARYCSEMCWADAAIREDDGPALPRQGPTDVGGEA
jgi:hypothetical protein